MGKSRVCVYIIFVYIFFPNVFSLIKQLKTIVKTYGIRQRLYAQIFYDAFSFRTNTSDSRRFCQATHMTAPRLQRHFWRVHGMLASRLFDSFYTPNDSIKCTTCVYARICLFGQYFMRPYRSVSTRIQFESISTPFEQ